MFLIRVYDRNTNELYITLHATTKEYASELMNSWNRGNQWIAKLEQNI